MKRQSIDELFQDLHITLNNKKTKTEKLYTQSEVDTLLKSQENILFNEFKKYIETIRSTVDIKIPHWTF